MSLAAVMIRALGTRGTAEAVTGLHSSGPSVEISGVGTPRINPEAGSLSNA